MKKIIAIALCSMLALTGCGRPLGTTERTYPTYGLFNEKSSKSNNVCYELSVGNIVWSIILVETIVMPIYFVGFSIYNPVRLKKSPTDDCSIDGA